MHAAGCLVTMMQVNEWTSLEWGGKDYTLLYVRDNVVMQLLLNFQNLWAQLVKICQLI